MNEITWFLLVLWAVCFAALIWFAALYLAARVERNNLKKELDRLKKDAIVKL